MPPPLPPRNLDILGSQKTTQRHFFFYFTLHSISPVIFATATVAAFVPLRHCYTQREATPTQKSARKGRCDLLLPLARKITKGIHSRKPSSLNRPTVDEAGSCCLLITLSDGLRCKVLGDEFFSQLMDSMVLQEIFQRPFSSNNDNKKKRKEKPTGQWRARNTHVTQIVSYRIFKRMVPIDYSYQPKKEYQEPSLLLVQ